MGRRRDIKAPSPDPPSFRNRLAGGLGLAALVGIPSLWQAYQFRDYTNDDAFITLRYAWNLVHGHGLVFNVGERVEGYTSLLHALLAALTIRVAGVQHAYAGIKLLSLACGLATLSCTVLLFRELFAPPKSGLPRPRPVSVLLSAGNIRAGAWLAGGIVAVSPSFAVNSLSGLETSLFALLLSFGLYLGAREADRPTTFPGSGCVFALMVLTRPEAPLLFAAYWCAAALPALSESRAGLRTMMSRPRLRALVRDAAIVVLTFIALLAFRHAYFDGEWLPNTYWAKQGGFWAQAWPYITNGILVPVFGLIGLALALVGMAIPPRALPARLLPIAAVAVAGALLPFVIGTDWMLGYRFSVPYIPLVAIGVAAGWMLLLARAPVRHAAFPVLAAAAIVAALWMWQEPARLGTRYTVSLRALGYETGHRRVAAWLCAHARPGETVALMDTGIIGYACPELRILDITGLTDRVIAKSPGGFLQKSYDVGYVLNQKPAFVVLTLIARGMPYTQPPPGTPFANFSKTEADIARHPEFLAAYVRPRAAPPEASGSWLDVLAAERGAELIYEHGHPGLYYLLAIYSRLD